MDAPACLALGPPCSRLHARSPLWSPQLFVTPRKPGLGARVQAARSRFLSADGDLMTYLEVLTQYLLVPEDKRYQWCRDHFINVRHAH